MEKIFFFLYSFIAFLLHFLSLPFLVFYSFKPKYKVSLPARFFLWHNRPLARDGICFHSCSFGEAKAIKPLVDRLPHEILRMTTTTHTGFEVISSYTKQSRYLPFESLLLFWMRRQKVLIVMEAEFWYLLFALTQKKGGKTLLINARMSERSFPKYQRIGWLYRYIFAHIDEVYAQTALDKERLESLGAKNVVVTGNIKLFELPKITREVQKPSGLLVCGASTHEGEEVLILDAFLDFKKEHIDAKLILVPRHPERFDTVAMMVRKSIKDTTLRTHRYQERKDFDSDIIVLDMLGELVNIYAISDIVVLGGAFEPIGGHNAAEAAQFGCKILSGKHYFNQKDIFDAIEGIAIVEASNLSRRLSQYGLLKPTRIKTKSDISPILESIERTLSDKKIK